MSTRRITTTICNLCGITSLSVGEQRFTRVGTYDFCRWCMSGPTRETSCGGHTVTISDGSWSCDCGGAYGTYGALVLRLRMHGVSLDVLDAVPNLAAATAAIHVQTPNWPQTW